MSSRSLGSLTLDLIARTAGFEQGLDRAARVADKKTREIERMAAARAKEIEATFKAIAAPIAAAFGVSSFASMVTGLANAADGLAKLSTRSGVAVEDLSKLQYAASLSDTSNEQLADSLTKLNKLMGEAADGSKTAAAAIARFDIKPGTSAIDAFRQIAEKVKNTGDATKVASALNDVFGRSYSDLIPLLKTGRDGIQEAGDELERMGGVMSGELAASSEAFNDNVTRLQTRMEAFKMQTLSPLIPLLLELSKSFVDTSEDADKLSKSGAFMKAVFETVAVVGVNVQYVFKGIGKEITGWGDQLKALSSGDFKAFAAIGDKMKVDAIAARKEVDALSERLLNPPKITAPVASTATGSGGISSVSASTGTNTGTSRTATQISEGQRLIAQLRERLLGTQDLNEVEKLQAQFADARYAKATAGEKDIALGIAGQIDARRNLLTELDNELDAVRKITDAYSEQESRLQSLVAATPSGQNSQRMQDEALAESALRSGKIDSTQYDQILGKFTEIKTEGEATFLDLSTVANDAARSMATGFVDFLFNPMDESIGDMLLGFLKAVAQMIAQTLALSVAKQAMSAMGFAKGGVFDGGGLQAFASGGVVNSPTPFRFASGGSFKAGVMGEAGPEAILPLKRGSDGKLGVTLNNGGGAGDTTVNIVVNNTSSGKQESTEGGDGAMQQFAGMIKSSVLQVIINEKRPGGLLYA